MQEQVLAYEKEYLIKGQPSDLDNLKRVDVYKRQLFFSIPYDKGWKVTIDGKEAKTHKIGDAFLGVNIYSGKHKVSLKYTPPGFTVGWKITVLSAAIFLILCKIIHSRKLRQLHASDFVRRF